MDPIISQDSVSESRVYFSDLFPGLFHIVVKINESAIFIFCNLPETIVVRLQSAIESGMMDIFSKHGGSEDVDFYVCRLRFFYDLCNITFEFFDRRVFPSPGVTDSTVEDQNLGLSFQNISLKPGEESGGIIPHHSGRDFYCFDSIFLRGGGDEIDVSGIQISLRCNVVAEKYDAVTILDFYSCGEV